MSLRVTCVASCNVCFVLLLFLVESFLFDPFRWLCCFALLTLNIFAWSFGFPLFLLFAHASGLYFVEFFADPWFDSIMLYSRRHIITVTFIRNQNQIMKVSGLTSHAWLSVCCLWRPNRKELVCFCRNLDTVSCRCCNGLRQGQFYQSRSMPCCVPYNDHSLVPCTDWRACSMVVDFQSQKTDSFELISKMLRYDGLLCALCICFAVLRELWCLLEKTTFNSFPFACLSALQVCSHPFGMSFEHNFALGAFQEDGTIRHSLRKAGSNSRQSTPRVSFCYIGKEKWNDEMIIIS